VCLVEDRAAADAQKQREITLKEKAMEGSKATAQTQAKKPNILAIMTDDVGIWNISAYHRGYR
jgi:arylsulfatase A-like enzyme